MRHHFFAGVVSLGDISRLDPVGKRGAEIPGLLAVMGHQLRLRRADEAVVKFLQYGRKHWWQICRRLLSRLA